MSNRTYRRDSTVRQVPHPRRVTGPWTTTYSGGEGRDRSAIAAVHNHRTFLSTNAHALKVTDSGPLAPILPFDAASSHTDARPGLYCPQSRADSIDAIHVAFSPDAPGEAAVSNAPHALHRALSAVLATIRPQCHNLFHHLISLRREAMARVKAACVVSRRGQRCGECNDRH